MIVSLPVHCQVTLLNHVFLLVSVAKSLGALSVSQQLFDSAQKRKILSEVVTDREAVDACVKFAGKLLGLFLMKFVSIITAYTCKCYLILDRGELTLLSM